MSEEPDPDLRSDEVAVAPSAITYRRTGFEEILFLEAQNATSKEALGEVLQQRDYRLDWDLSNLSAAQHIPPPAPKKSRAGVSASSSSSKNIKRVGPPITTLPMRRAPERAA